MRPQVQQLEVQSIVHLLHLPSDLSDVVLLCAGALERRELLLDGLQAVQVGGDLRVSSALGARRFSDEKSRRMRKEKGSDCRGTCLAGAELKLLDAGQEQARGDLGFLLQVVEGQAGRDREAEELRVSLGLSLPISPATMPTCWARIQCTKRCGVCPHREG